MGWQVHGDPSGYVGRASIGDTVIAPGTRSMGTHLDDLTVRFKRHVIAYC
jgi:hypothetical protein